MATKSVIEIELIDEQFKAFSTQLKALQAIVASLPNQWKAVTKAVNDEQKAESKAANEAEKARKKRIQEEKDLNKVIEDRKKLFMDSAYFTSSIAKNLASGALSIAKWTTLAAIGGGFGLGGLAASASDYRRRSQGLGTSTAGLRAAEVNLSKYIDVNSVLSNITSLQHDITQQYKLERLGGTKTGDTAEQLQRVMLNAVNDFKNHGKDVNYAKAVGLTDIFSPEELIRLSSLSADELSKTFRQLAQDREKFKLSDDNSRRWQEFWNQLGRAGQSIQVLLLDKLEGLSVPLTELSDTIIKVIRDFLDTHNIKEWMNDFGKSIERFGSYLNSPEFQQDLNNFAEAMKRLGEAAYGAAKFLGLIDKSKEEKAQDKRNVSDINVLRGDIRRDVNEPLGSWFKSVINKPFISDMRSIAERNNNPGNIKFANQPNAIMGEGGFAKFDTVEHGFQALQNQLQLYSSGQSKAAGYKKLNTLEDILPIYAPPNQNNTRAYIENLERLTGKGRSEQLDFSNPNLSSQIMSGIAKIESGKNLYSPAQIQVMITNTTDTNVAVKGLTNK
jgi:hypothetical protein